MSDYLPFPPRFNIAGTGLQSSRSSQNSQGVSRIIEFPMERTQWTSRDLRRAVEAGNCVKLWSEKVQDHVAIVLAKFDARKWCDKFIDTAVYTLCEFDLLRRHRLPAPSLKFVNQIKKIFNATIVAITPSQEEP